MPIKVFRNPGFTTPIRIGITASRLVRKEGSPTGQLPRQRCFATKAILRPNIAVVGGGHGGISVALRLVTMPWTRLTKPKITLVDKSSRFCFLPMLYELALGQVEQWEIAPKFEDLLQDTSIDFVYGEVQELDLKGNSINGTRLGGNRDSDFRLPFDRVVLAMGSQPSNLASVPGADEFAIPFHTLANANSLKLKLKELRAKKRKGDVINVIVVGASFSGVELASCLAEDLGSAGSVLLVEPSDKVLARGTRFNRTTSERALTTSGVFVAYHSRVTRITESSVQILKETEDDNEDRDYPYDIILWTAGSTPNALQGKFGLPIDSRGRIVTDSTLQVEQHPDLVYALGDGASTPSSDGYYGTAQVAVQQAEYVAWNIWASLTENPKLRYNYTHLGEMMVLGSANASVTTTPGVELDGRLAWATRRLAYLARMPTDNHRAKVAASWAAHPVLARMENIAKSNVGVDTFRAASKFGS